MLASPRFLLDTKITCRDDALAACLRFHALGIKTVVITSMTLGKTGDAPSEQDKPAFELDSNSPYIDIIASAVPANSQGKPSSPPPAPQPSPKCCLITACRAVPTEFVTLTVPHYKGVLTGTGDLTSALLLAHHKKPLKEALELT